MTEDKPIRSMTDARLDFTHGTPMRQSYIVASSPRSGSTYLCRLLGQSGLLGTPSEVLNPGFDLQAFKNRFKASSPADYIAELIARRTAKSGVFGLKAHFENFEGFLKEYPALLDVLSPVTYIYINRRDRVAQAVSMARALQTNQWSSQAQEGKKPELRYNRELIANSMKEVELQDAGWLNWFKAKNITPFRLTYEDLLADPAGTVQSVVEYLGVQNAERDEVKVPPVEKQSDDTNQEWIERFRRETEGGGSGDGDSRRRRPPSRRGFEASGSAGPLFRTPGSANPVAAENEGFRHRFPGPDPFAPPLQRDHWAESRAVARRPRP